MRSELNKKAEELEQTLQMQLSIVKKDSGDFIKIGAVVLASAGLAFVAFKLLKGKNNKTKKILEVLEKEGLLDKEIEEKLTSKRQPGLMGRLGAVLLPIAVNYGREQIMNRLNEPKRKPEEDAK